MKKIALIGVGPGDASLLTAAAAGYIQTADLMIGAERLIAMFPECRAEKQIAVRAEDICRILSAAGAKHAAVLLSGDVGFYSGAARLRAMLPADEVEIFCGISSMQYLCARIGCGYEDAFFASAHGRNCDIAALCAAHPKLILLTDGDNTPQKLCADLDHAGFGAAQVWIGERLSYSDEKVTCDCAKALAKGAFSPLSVMMFIGAKTAGRQERPVTHGLPDEAFVRGETPMTKREIRSVALSMLELRSDDCCWDVGAGTGSVSIEMALQAARGEVWAIEQKAEACALIERNREKFGARNLHVIRGGAPDALAELPAPDAVFIGGSGGQMTAILRAAAQSNPHVRIVVTAIAPETAVDALRILEELGFEVEMTQISAARGKKAGKLHMMLAQNPVTILAARREAAHEK